MAGGQESKPPIHQTEPDLKHKEGGREREVFRADRLTVCEEMNNHVTNTQMMPDGITAWEKGGRGDRGQCHRQKESLRLGCSSLLRSSREPRALWQVQGPEWGSATL